MTATPVVTWPAVYFTMAQTGAQAIRYYGAPAPDWADPTQLQRLRDIGAITDLTQAEQALITPTMPTGKPTGRIRTLADDETF